MLRTFLALDLDESFLGATAALAERLRIEAGERELSRARWVDPSVMHITLRFFGETEEALVPALGDLAAKLCDDCNVNDPIRLRASSLVAFPKERRAHVLALRVTEERADNDTPTTTTTTTTTTVLPRLAEEAERAALALGFTPERHTFNAHLTLARIREPPADLRRLIAAASSDIAIAGQATSITLYQSVLGPNGPTYTSLRQTYFGRAQTPNT